MTRKAVPASTAEPTTPKQAPAGQQPDTVSPCAESRQGIQQPDRFVLWVLQTCGIEVACASGRLLVLAPL
jgi:hypothetical protein